MTPVPAAVVKNIKIAVDETLDYSVTQHPISRYART